MSLALLRAGLPRGQSESSFIFSRFGYGVRGSRRRKRRPEHDMHDVLPIPKVYFELRVQRVVLSRLVQPCRQDLLRRRLPENPMREQRYLYAFGRGLAVFELQPHAELSQAELRKFGLCL